MKRNFKVRITKHGKMKMDNKSDVENFKWWASRFIGEIVVNGKKYKIYEDIGQTRKWAVNEDGDIRLIYHGDDRFSTVLATRKAIANAFGLPTFRE